MIFIKQIYESTLNNEEALVVDFAVTMNMQ